MSLVPALPVPADMPHQFTRRNTYSSDRLCSTSLWLSRWPAPCQTEPQTWKLHVLSDSWRYCGEGGAENAGVDNAAPSSRGGKRGEIWRPKKKWNMLNDTRIKACMTRCDNGAYSRIQFLTAVSHAMGAHSEALCPAADSSSSSDEDEASSATTTAADSSLW